MKKLFGLLIALCLIQEIVAQDTLRTCGTHVGYYDLLPFCPSGGAAYFAFVNGDTISVLNDSFPPGTKGLLTLICINPIPDTTTLYLIAAGLPQICVMTSDTNNHLTVYMDSAGLLNHQTLSLKRQVNTVTWQTITTFQPNDPLIIIDSSVNTSSQSYNYRIESNDFTCNSVEVTSLHLQANGNNLIWNAGGGAGLRGYYIYKRSGNTFILIDSTANLTYTDANFQNGDEYFVEAFKDDGCQSNSWLKTSSPVSVRSNKLKIGTSSINTPEQTLIEYYVDGSILFVKLKKTDDIWVHDLLGREVVHQRTDRLNVRLETGIYLMNVGTKAYKITIH